jgi:hypothetical protein
MALKSARGIRECKEGFLYPGFVTHMGTGYWPCIWKKPSKMSNFGDFSEKAGV